MEIANCLVGLGGDRGNTVPKYNVTPSEILVLQAIHGGDAVHEIEPAGDVERSGRDEISRLRDVYKGRNDDNKPHVEVIFPGVTSPSPTTFRELNLPAEFFRAKARLVPGEVTASARAAAAAAPVQATEDDLPEVESDSFEPEVQVDEDTAEPVAPVKGRARKSADILG